LGNWQDQLIARLSFWRAAGLERRLRVAEGGAARVRLASGTAPSPPAPLPPGEREVVNFAGNDYLALSADPRVIAAAKAALDAYGAGATASRLLGGTRPIHAELEAELARFKRCEACLVFASGYHAAMAIFDLRFAIADLDNSNDDEDGQSKIENRKSEMVILLDRLAHASLIDGARLSGARMRTFKHNDMEDLGRLLKREAAPEADARGSKRKAKSENRKWLLVVTESLFSMDGDVAPLREMYELTHAAGALLLVDEAHATGVLGPQGRGVLAEVFDGVLPPDVLALGTLSKALGSQGGFLCASKLVMDVILHAGRAFLFSTGLAPAAAGAALAALRIAEKDGARRKGLLWRAEDLRTTLRSRGWKVLGGLGPILPIMVGDEAAAARLADKLLQQGVWAPAVRYPTVKRGQARLRVSLNAAHTDEDVAKLVEALGRGA